MIPVEKHLFLADIQAAKEKADQASNVPKLMVIVLSSLKKYTENGVKIAGVGCDHKEQI